MGNVGRTSSKKPEHAQALQQKGEMEAGTRSEMKGMYAYKKLAERFRVLTGKAEKRSRGIARTGAGGGGRPTVLLGFKASHFLLVQSLGFAQHRNGKSGFKNRVILEPNEDDLSGQIYFSTPR
jgi:hypothetical protein